MLSCLLGCAVFVLCVLPYFRPHDSGPIYPSPAHRMHLSALTLRAPARAQWRLSSPRATMPSCGSCSLSPPPWTCPSSPTAPLRSSCGTSCSRGCSRTWRCCRSACAACWGTPPSCRPLRTQVRAACPAMRSGFPLGCEIVLPLSGHLFRVLKQPGHCGRSWRDTPAAGRMAHEICRVSACLGLQGCQQMKDSCIGGVIRAVMRSDMMRQRVWSSTCQSLLRAQISDMGPSLALFAGSSLLPPLCSSLLQPATQCMPAGRILNVAVSPADTNEPARILNYLTAPNVIIWSAVSCSSAFPFLFLPQDLLARDANGDLVRYAAAQHFERIMQSRHLLILAIWPSFNIAACSEDVSCVGMQPILYGQHGIVAAVESFGCISPSLIVSDHRSGYGCMPDRPHEDDA